MELNDIKSILETQGRAFEEFKKANDELIKAKADGKAIGDLEAKVSKLSEAMDKASEEQKNLEAALVKAQRPGVSGDEKSAAGEVKSFNDMARAHAQSKGRGYTDMTAENYAQYKSAFEHMVRVGKDNLSAEELQKMLEEDEA